MKKALASVGISSTVVTVLINLIPDTVTKILLFTLFGIAVFGISWGLSQIKSALNGLVFGLFLGVCLGIVIAVIDNSAASMNMDLPYANATYYLILSFKWILPILAYTYFGVEPWKNK